MGLAKICSLEEIRTKILINFHKDFFKGKIRNWCGTVENLRLGWGRMRNWAKLKLTDPPLPPFFEAAIPPCYLRRKEEKGNSHSIGSAETLATFGSSSPWTLSIPFQLECLHLAGGGFPLPPSRSFFPFRVIYFRLQAWEQGLSCPCSPQVSLRAPFQPDEQDQKCFKEITKSCWRVPGVTASLATGPEWHLCVTLAFSQHGSPLIEERWDYISHIFWKVISCFRK